MIAIWIYFQSRNDNFLTARNLSNLILQIAVLGTLAVGLVLVLIIGEIDLSVAAVSGFCAGVLAQLLAHGWSTPVAILAAIATGVVIGLVQGALVVYLHIPSFVVTLTGLLVWQGLLLGLIGDAGEVRISDSVRQIHRLQLPDDRISPGRCGIILIAGVAASRAGWADGRAPAGHPDRHRPGRSRCASPSSRPRWQ